MVQDFIDAWNQNKYQLELWLRNDVYAKDVEYDDIVKAIFERVINPFFDTEYHRYDFRKMTVIDDGDYQGTRIYIIPLDTYQPDETEYIVTHTWYGSSAVR